MFRRYAIVSSADQREAVEALERARERNLGAERKDLLSTFPQKTHRPSAPTERSRR